MKPITFLLSLYSCLCISQSKANPVSPFLDQIVTQFPNVRDLTITGNEAVFSAQSAMGDISVLLSVKKLQDQWSTPEVISFSGQYFDMEPSFSEDGLTLYFASNRPLDLSSTETKDFDIWYLTRPSLVDNWSSPKNMGAPINTKMDEFYPVITKSGNLYFTLDNPELNQKDDIYVSAYVNGAYSEPQRLGDGINSNGYEFNAFVSPDESFMIYSCYNREDGLGSGDLYISYQNDKGWTQAKNMGASINSDKMDYCPFVDTKTNTLYFTSKRITTTPLKSSVNLEALKALFNRYENGASRLYQVSIAQELEKQ
ncbi:hypothetical protein ACS386_10850 [Flavobacteriaceae bacterium LMO-SS05]